MDEKIADDAAQQTFQRDGTHPAQMAGSSESKRGEKNQQPGCAQELGHRRSNLAGAEPAHSEYPQKNRKQKRSNAKSLQEQIRKQRSDYAYPVPRHARAGQHRGAVERWIERRIGGQSEKKEERGDAQQEPDQLIEPPVVGGRKKPVEILHRRISRHARTPLRPAIADYARAQ